MDNERSEKTARYDWCHACRATRVRVLNLATKEFTIELPRKCPTQVDCGAEMRAPFTHVGEQKDLSPK